MIQLILYIFSCHQNNVAYHSVFLKNETTEAYKAGAVGRVKLHAIYFKVACAGNRSNRND